MKIISKYYSLLDSKLKNYFIFLFFLLIFGMLFEMISISLIFPLIVSILNPDFVQKYISFMNLNYTDNELIIIMTVFIGIVFLFKNSFMVYLLCTQNKFINLVQVFLGKKLFKIYLSLPYKFHINKKSSELIRNMIQEAHTTSYSLNQLILLLTELLVLIGILGVLIYIEPLVTIFVFIIISFFSLIFYKYTKNKSIKWGEERVLHSGKVTKTIIESLGGIKELKIYNKEKYFYKKFSHSVSIHSLMNRFNSIVISMPRFLLEILAVICLVLIVMFVILYKNETTNIVALLAIFSVAAFRLLPSFNRILSALQIIKFSHASVDILSREFSLTNSGNYFDYKGNMNKNLIKFHDKIELKNINFNYSSRKDKFSIVDINFTINKGDVIGIIGPSGSGKSTILDLILGLLEPESGKILIDGIDQTFSKNRYSNLIAYVPQKIFLIDDSILNNIALGIEEKDIDMTLLKKALKQSKLDEFVNTLKDGVHTEVGENGIKISGGQLQRLGIARALYTSNEIIIFDESTSSLDLKTETEVMNSIYSLLGTKTIIIVTHRKSTIERCNKFISINNGKIIEIKTT